MKLPPKPYPWLPGNDYTAADMDAYGAKCYAQGAADQLSAEPVAWKDTLVLDDGEGNISKESMAIGYLVLDELPDGTEFFFKREQP